MITANIGLGLGMKYTYQGKNLNVLSSLSLHKDEAHYYGASPLMVHSVKSSSKYKDKMEGTIIVMEKGSVGNFFKSLKIKEVKAFSEKIEDTDGNFQSSGIWETEKYMKEAKKYD